MPNKPKNSAVALDAAAALNTTLADFGEVATRAAAELGRSLQALRKTKAGGRSGGPPLRYPRCPCGLMTAARALQRNHKCQPAA